MNFRKELLIQLSTMNFLKDIIALENIYIQYYPKSQVEDFFRVFIENNINFNWKLKNPHAIETKHKWLIDNLNKCQSLMQQGQNPDFQVFVSEAKKNFPEDCKEKMLNSDPTKQLLNDMSELRSIFIKYYKKSDVDDFFSVFRNAIVNSNNEKEKIQEWLTSNLNKTIELLDNGKYPDFVSFKTATEKLFFQDFYGEIDDNNDLLSSEYSSQVDSKRNLDTIYEEVEEEQAEKEIMITVL